MTSSPLRGVARHPVVAFVVIGLVVGFLVGVIPPIVDSEILPLDLPLHGLVSSALGVGLAAFVVTYALSGRAGVADLARRSVRWRVPLRWYLIALLTVPVGAALISLVIYGGDALATPSGGWPRVLAVVAATFGLQLVLFQLPEEIGFTGFLQHHWQDRYHPMKLTALVALLWALWHVPDHFAEEGWGCRAAHRCADHLRYRVRLALLRPRPVRLALQPDPEQRVAGGHLPCQLRRRDQPAARPCGSGVEHGTVLHLQRRDHRCCNGRHDRYQGAAGTQRELCPRGGQLASAEAGSCSAL